MTAVPVSGSAEARLRAAIDELYQAAEQQGREAIRAGGYRQDVIERCTVPGA